MPERPWSLLLLAILTGLATAGLEAAWYGLASGVPASLVLAANLDFSGPIRPAWWVLAVGLSLPLLALVRGPKARAAGPAPTRRPAATPRRDPVREPLSPRA